MGLGDMFRGLYDILGVSPDATSEEIKKAGRDRQKETHPDAGGDHDSFVAVNKAVTILLSPEHRAHYDQTGDDEPKSAENAVQADAMSYLNGIVIQLVEGDVADAGQDVIAVMKDIAHAARNDVVQQIANLEKTAKKHERNLKRFRRTDNKPNFLKVALETRLASVRKGVLDLQKKELDKYDKAIDLLQNYRFDRGMPETPWGTATSSTGFNISMTGVRYGY